MKSILTTLAIGSLVLSVSGMAGFGYGTPVFAETAPGTSFATSAQNRLTVSGTVKDASGLPLPGVTVRLKETNLGTMTGADGTFKLTVPQSMTQGTLVFSFIGMKEKEVTVKFSGNTAPVNVVMEDNIELLDEVVVTGYQTISKERATGSFAMLDGDNLKAKVANNLLPQLEGKVPGLVINKTGNLAIRGQSTLQGVTSPLLVVDGMPYEGKLTDLNPALIQDVTVLKDAAAASIYGARAANGVIVIRTLEGGKNQKTRVAYQGNLIFSTKPNLNDIHLMGTREMLELNKYGVQFDLSPSDKINPRNYSNPFDLMLLRYRDKKVTETDLDKEIDRLSAYNNWEELSDFYYRPAFNQQHTLSVSGGGDRYGYVASIDYEKDAPNDRFQNAHNLGFSLRNNIKFFDWFKADAGLYGQFDTMTDDLGVSTLESMLRQIPSFQPLRDPETGKPTYVALDNKSLYELKRLQEKGLLDEFYSPVSNAGKETRLFTGANYRANIGLNFDLTHGLDLDLRYQGEWEYNKTKDLYAQDSWHAKNMINNAATIDRETGEITYNVPLGGQMSQGRDNMSAYTVRAQMNYRLDTDNHYITALAGAEVRGVKYTSQYQYFMGYDDTSLGHKSINADDLNYIQGTESREGFFSWEYTKNNYLAEVEDRFISIYANASYSYLSKYDVTGSIRIDQSNLFGTDPRFQYRPLWSLGGSWHIGKEEFMGNAKSWLSKLTIRLTYGIGGNVPKNTGPFLTLYAPEYNGLIGDFGSEIKNPPNPTLRWEKTATTNVGVDFGIFRNKVYGSIDFYYKKTTDLLAFRQIDPTNGFDSQLLNYGSLRNRGIEVGLYGNFDWNGFSWSPSLIVSYNANKLLDVEDDATSAFERSSRPVDIAGKPANSLYSYRGAGLSPKNGLPQFYDKEGKVISYGMTIDDLVYSGTTVPTTNTALTNLFSYKGLSLSFMLTYAGGHIFRNVVPAYLSVPSLSNLSVEHLKVWKKPGDEKDISTAPAYTGEDVHYTYNQAWQNTDTSVLRGDVLKLRDLTLSYELPSDWLELLHAESVRVTLQGQNLFTVGLNKLGVNPDNYSNMGNTRYGAYGYVYTPSRVFSVGLSVGF